MRYKLTSYNKGETINEGSDSPIKPNGIIASISFETKAEALVYFDIWQVVADQNSILYRQNIVLTCGDDILETHKNYVE